MRFLKTATDYGLIFFNTLLLFLLVFENNLSVPNWLPVLGRTHILFLHLPIGLWVAVLLLYLLRKHFESSSELLGILLNITALFTSLSALAGLLLSLDKGYLPDQIFSHKYAGVILSFLLWLLAIYYHKIGDISQKISLALSSILVVLTGHFGGEITHGSEFLSFNSAEEKKILNENDPIFESLVLPILKEKCRSCHNPSKMKGGLDVSSFAALIKGGESGAGISLGDAMESHIMKSIFLPLDDKKHMPPKQKSQLTDEEIEILTTWINESKSEATKFSDLASESVLRTFLTSENADEKYDFNPASASAIEKLNTPFSRISPIATGSPALEAAFFVSSKFDVNQLEKLKEVKEQLVSLDLAKMPVKDGDLKVLSHFKNLRTLNLSGTEVNGGFLLQLKDLKHLKSLSVANTKIKEIDLKSLSNLKKLYVWESGIDSKQLEEIKKKYPQLAIVEGYDDKNGQILQLNPPNASRQSGFISSIVNVELLHALSGVEINYTLDGTEPDSIVMQYKNPIKVDKNTTIKARAFKKGWLGSSAITFHYIFRGLIPDSIILLTQANPKYPGKGAKSLSDGKKGELSNFLDKNWIGYRDNSMEAEFLFNKPSEIKNIIVSMLESSASYIFPARIIEVWDMSSKPKLIGKANPVLPSENRTARNVFQSITLPKQAYKKLKLVIKPVNPLPAWHEGKGTSAWIFVDEVVFN